MVWLSRCSCPHDGVQHSRGVLSARAKFRRVHDSAWHVARKATASTSDTLTSLAKRSPGRLSSHVQVALSDNADAHELVAPARQAPSSIREQRPVRSGLTHLDNCIAMIRPGSSIWQGGVTSVDILERKPLPLDGSGESSSRRLVVRSAQMNDTSVQHTVQDSTPRIEVVSADQDQSRGGLRDAPPSEAGNIVTPDDDGLTKSDSDSSGADSDSGSGDSFRLEESDGSESDNESEHGESDTSSHSKPSNKRHHSRAHLSEGLSSANVAIVTGPLNRELRSLQPRPSELWAVTGDCAACMCRLRDVCIISQSSGSSIRPSFVDCLRPCSTVRGC
jgi:hypothetical protein